MKSLPRKLAMLVLAAIFLLGIGLVIHQMLDAHYATQSNSQAQSIAGITQVPSTKPFSSPVSIPVTTTPSETTSPETTQETLPPDENTSYLQKLNIPALQEVNPEVIGWIHIPDTEVSYPLLHTQDNSTYLDTAWDGTENVAGSIFLETHCSADLTDFNTIIYGHNMRNGSMFGALKGYHDFDFYQEHPYIYIVTGDTIYRYAIFSAYEAGITTDTYRLRFNTYVKKQLALHHYLESSVWDTGISPTSDDYILTLSTCTGTGTYETRWVVQAMLDGQWKK